MEVRQLSIFLNNEPGSLYQVTELLKSANVNIRALSIVDSTDFGLVRMIVNNTDEAKSALESQYVVKLNQVVVVDVEDQPGGLSGILKTLEDNAVNIEYVYAFAGGADQGKALVIFKFDDNAKAIEVFEREGIRLIDESHIASI